MMDSQEEIAGSKRPSFTIGTLVNDDAQYEAMRASFAERGFVGDDVEFIAVRGASSAYAGLNGVLQAARGELVILCHQDVRLIGAGRGELETRLRELEGVDPNWALAGNAGGAAAGRLAVRISDPHGENRTTGELPARVMSLDENFIVVRKETGVAFSRDIGGFHLYGADICLVADILGWSAWVIDFHLKHLSPGNKDASFTEAEDRFRNKWTRALRPRWMQTPCTLLRIGGWKSATPGIRIGEKVARRIVRRLPGADGWTSPTAENAPALRK